MRSSTSFVIAALLSLPVATVCFTGCRQADMAAEKTAVSAPAAPADSLETDESDGVDPDEEGGGVAADEEIRNLDCLAVVPVTQFPLHQATLDTLEGTRLDKDFLCYQEKGQASVEFAYRMPGSADWYTFTSPFPAYQGLNIEAAEWVDLDGSGKPELLLRGKACGYGTGAGMCQGGLAIYQLEEELTRLFLTINSCVTEGYRSPNSTEDNEFRCETVQEVQLKHGALLVGKTKAPKDDRCCSDISQLETGKYRFRNGRFRR